VFIRIAHHWKNMCICACMHFVRVYAVLWMYSYIMYVYSLHMYVHLYVCMYITTHAWMYLCICRPMYECRSMYNCIYECMYACMYVCMLLHLYPRVHVYRHVFMTIDMTRTVRMGPRSFAVSGPTLWNLLPVELKTMQIPLESIKSKLKTCLFTKAHDQWSSWNHV